MAAKQARKRHVQLTLESARRVEQGKHGGWRPGAGRKKQPGTISHATRTVLSARDPQHVTLRIAEGVRSLASEWLMKIIRNAIKESQKATFRVVEFNVLGNHLHLITEAADKQALSTGMQGLEVRLARRLNAAMKRSGALFAHRYHARALGTPTEVRNALRYVLLNRKHHAAEKRFNKTWIDPFSSALWFGGWATKIRIDTPWLHALAREERPTVDATTWLLSTGWKKLHGPLRVDDRPS